MSHEIAVSETDALSDDEDNDANPRAFPLYVDEVQRGFELECRDTGRALVMSNGLDTDASVAEASGRVDALAVFPGTATLSALAHLPHSMPVVLLNRPPADDRYHRVLVKNNQGVRDLVTHLFDVHGFERLEFVGSIQVPEFAERFEAFQTTVSANGRIAPAAPLDSTSLGESAEFDGLTRAIESKDLPDALVCANDQIALAVMELLQRKRLRVPRDIAVTGFDGILAGRLSEPTLTTVRQPMTAMGRRAAQILMLELETPSVAPQVHRFDVQLRVRSSCGCAPGVRSS